MKGTLQFMAPELLRLTTHDVAHTNAYAADMWSLGETVFQMLTKQPAFPQFPQLLSYIQGSQPFPDAVLAGYGVSRSGQNFISSTMLPSPDNRLTVIQAWDHEWIALYKTSCPVTSDRYISPSIAYTANISVIRVPPLTLA